MEIKKNFNIVTQRSLNPPVFISSISSKDLLFTKKASISAQVSPEKPPSKPPSQIDLKKIETLEKIQEECISDMRILSNPQKIEPRSSLPFSSLILKERISYSTSPVYKSIDSELLSKKKQKRNIDHMKITLKQLRFDLDKFKNIKREIDKMQSENEEIIRVLKKRSLSINSKQDISTEKLVLQQKGKIKQLEDAKKQLMFDKATLQNKSIEDNYNLIVCKEKINELEVSNKRLKETIGFKEENEGKVLQLAKDLKLVQKENEELREKMTEEEAKARNHKEELDFCSNENIKLMQNSIGLIEEILQLKRTNQELVKEASKRTEDRKVKEEHDSAFKENEILNEKVRQLGFELREKDEKFEKLMNKWKRNKEKKEEVIKKWETLEKDLRKVLQEKSWLEKKLNEFEQSKRESLENKTSSKTELGEPGDVKDFFRARQKSEVIRAEKDSQNNVEKDLEIKSLYALLKELQSKYQQKIKNSKMLKKTLKEKEEELIFLRSKLEDFSIKDRKIEPEKSPKSSEKNQSEGAIHEMTQTTQDNKAFEIQTLMSEIVRIKTKYKENKKIWKQFSQKKNLTNENKEIQDLIVKIERIQENYTKEKEAWEKNELNYIKDQESLRNSQKDIQEKILKIEDLEKKLQKELENNLVCTRLIAEQEMKINEIVKNHDEYLKLQQNLNSETKEEYSQTSSQFLENPPEFINLKTAFEEQVLLYQKELENSTSLVGKIKQKDAEIQLIKESLKDCQFKNSKVAEDKKKIIEELEDKIWGFQKELENKEKGLKDLNVLLSQIEIKHREDRECLENSILKKEQNFAKQQDTFNELLQDKKVEISNLKEKIEQLNTDSEELKEKYKRSLSKSNQVIQDLQSTIEKLEAIHKETVENSLKTIEEKDTELQSIESNFLEMKKIERKRTEELDTLAKAETEKNEEIKNYLKELEELKESHSRLAGDYKLKVEELDKSLKEKDLSGQYLHETIQQLKNTHLTKEENWKNEEQKLRSRYEEVLNTLAEYQKIDAKNKQENNKIKQAIQSKFTEMLKYLNLVNEKLETSFSKLEKLTKLPSYLSQKLQVLKSDLSGKTINSQKPSLSSSDTYLEELESLIHSQTESHQKALYLIHLDIEERENTFNQEILKLSNENSDLKKDLKKVLIESKLLLSKPASKNLSEISEKSTETENPIPEPANDQYSILLTQYEECNDHLNQLKSQLSDSLERNQELLTENESLIEELKEFQFMNKR